MSPAGRPGAAQPPSLPADLPGPLNLAELESLAAARLDPGVAACYGGGAADVPRELLVRAAQGPPSAP